MAAAGGLQPGAGGVLLVVDLLRRGGHRRAQRCGLSADLYRPLAAAAVRLAHHRAPGADRAQPERGLHRRFHLFAFRPLAAAGSAGGDHRADRHHSVPGPAVQSGGDEPAGADRQHRPDRLLQRPGVVRGPVDGAVRHPVRYPPGRCHRASPRHDAGHCAGVRDQAGGDGGGGRVRLRLAQRPQRSGGGVGAYAVHRAASGGLPVADAAQLPRHHLPAAPVPRSGGRVRGCARRTPCALEVRRLPGAHLGDGAADRHRRCQPVRYRQWRGR
ncbi:hypothetical protein G6F31_014358 [Rhizopus arrhizus]|nr:hypothetical protein G6F31_014358 [Rhizopus arrhizus]